MSGSKIIVLGLVAVAVAIVGALVYGGIRDGAEADFDLAVLEIKAKPGLVGGRNVNPCEGPEKEYTFLVKNNEATAQGHTVTVSIDPLTGLGGAHVIDIFSANVPGAVTSTNIPAGGQAQLDVDPELEGSGLATLSLAAGETVDMHVLVSYDPPGSCPGSDITPADYQLCVDVGGPLICKNINEKNR